MATSERLRLQADELAFVFDSEVGVKAADLADFLKKASTVSRRAGAELYVVGPVSYTHLTLPTIYSV